MKLSLVSQLFVGSMVLSFGFAPARAATNSIPTLEQTATEFYGSERARQTLASFPSRGARTDVSIPPKSPDETLKSFALMDGLEATVVLSEPIVRQPVFLNFDERGRMWVVQFLQYPYPAGVKVIDFDDQFHAVYDRVPPPPPHHDRGRDKITIHEDRDGDGVFETHKTFLEGLNMVTSIARGRGGVWVMNPPYLLFWPDRNNDDVPDGNPTVHLAGFGLEDTHSAANSLCWGPDGWVYGGQGSGVSSKITKPGFETDNGLYFKGQVIWRYHPETRVFELFAEGGGNTFGLEFDSAGRAWSGINGAHHRGFHFVQGGYYSKNFGEHGFFTNPNTFGYFPPMPHQPESPRFSHTFVIYEGAALGEHFDGRIIAPVPLQNNVILTELQTSGSTYSTRDLGMFLQSKDPWFRPVDIKVGPDGSVYIADWYDTRLTHMDPRDTWDREHGRIYRVRKSNTSTQSVTSDLRTLPSEKLVLLLSHENKWYRQTALRLLFDRHDGKLIPRLERLARDPKNPRALDALWALHASGGFDQQIARELLSHPHGLVRLWTVRLIGERWGAGTAGLGAKPASALPPSLRTELSVLAREEPDPQVRSQAASTAKRLAGDAALPLIFALAERDDWADAQIPLLIWWALEAHAAAQRSQILDYFSKPQAWSKQLIREQIIPRLARFYATVPTKQNQETLAALLRSAPEPAARNAVVRGINEAFKGRAAEQLISSLEEELNLTSGLGPVALALAVRRGSARELSEALALISDESVSVENRVALIEALSESRNQNAIAPLLEILSRSRENAVQGAALAGLGRFDSEEIPQEILARWSFLDSSLKRRALEVLCNRKSWAKRFLLAAGASGVISKADVPNDIALRIRLFGDEELNSLCDRYFGANLRPSTSEKQKQTDRIKNVVHAGGPSNIAAGKQLFATRCGVCHTIFGEGGNIGPELTSAERSNLDNMLLSIVDPGVAIREGFTLFQFQLSDDRDLVGFIADRDGNQIKLKDAAGQLTTFGTNEVRNERALTTSIMPEGLLDDLRDQELRDLFGYFMQQHYTK